MKPRVVIFRSTPIAPEPRVEKVAAVLSADYQVHVVGWDRTGNLPVRQEQNGFSLERFSLAAPFGSGMKNLGRLLRWQLFLFGWVLRHGKGVQVIHACDFDTIFPALLAKMLFGSRVVYDIFDFYADHIRNTPGWVKQIIRGLDHMVIRQVDAVILVDESRRAQLKGVPVRRLEVIYNSPMNMPAAPDVVNVSADLRLAYVGLLVVERGLDLVLDILRQHPNWHLDLAGFGGDEAQIRARLAGMPNVTWHGQVPYEQALALSQAADVLFATYDPAVPNHRYSSPNKIFEAMLLGKPIVVARGTNMDQIVEANRCGLVVTYGEPAALEAALERLAQDPQLRADLGRNARRAYDFRYSWDKMGDKLVALYASLFHH